MPLYEYQCQACGKKTELLQKMNDARSPSVRVRRRGQEAVLVPGRPVQGTGWYVTDYKKGGSSGSGPSREG